MKKILMRFIYWILMEEAKITVNTTCFGCLLYTSDAADE